MSEQRIDKLRDENRELKHENAALVAALRNLFRRGENYATIRETSALLDKYEEAK